MTREWKEGDYAFVTYHGEPILLQRAPAKWYRLQWGDQWPDDNEWPDDVPPKRPAVVLDSADLDGIADWIERARVAADVPGSVPLSARLIRIEDAIRAATDKPRMPEPGWGEKVTAHAGGDESRRRFVGVLKPWTTEELAWMDERGSAYQWDELIDPEPAS